MMAALQLVQSIPFCVPSIRGMLPTGSPNITMLTPISPGSFVARRRSGSIRSGSASSVTTEKR